MSDPLYVVIPILCRSKEHLNASCRTTTCPPTITTPTTIVLEDNFQFEKDREVFPSNALLVEVWFINLDFSSASCWMVCNVNPLSLSLAAVHIMTGKVLEKSVDEKWELIFCDYVSS